MAELERIREAARKRMQDALPEMMARVEWPRARLDEFREDRLREVLARAMEHSPWHRERLAGVDPARLRLEDLPALPSMSKADLMSNFDGIATDSRITLERCEEQAEKGEEPLLEGEFTLGASGGTSGVRALGVSRVDWMGESFAAGLIRFVARWGVRTGALAGPTAPLIIASAPGPHAGSMLSRIFGAGGPRLSVVDPLDEIVAALNAAEPAHLATYSSFVPRLLDEAHAGRLRIRPKLLSPVAEPFLPEHEQQVAEVWGCGVITSYGATETGLLGVGTGFDPGMVLVDDMVVVEPVDTSGRPVAPGQRADKLFVTPLRPAVLPVVRYELTDQLTVLEEPASCGTSFTRVSQVLGRLDDEFTYDGAVKVHPHVFRTVLGRRRAIREYQVEQNAHGATVRAVLATGREDELDAAATSREIEQHLARLGVRDPRVQVEAVTDIPRHPSSGKLKRFVPMRIITGSR